MKRGMMQLAFLVLILLLKNALRVTPTQALWFCARRAIGRTRSHQPQYCAMWLSEVEGGWLEVEVEKEPAHPSTGLTRAYRTILNFLR